jgi:hypothetical protein
MHNNVTWLRISYWTGAVIDALAALLLTFPRLNAWFSGFAAADNSAAFRSSNDQAAALMWGWTLLLLWADRRPLERRGVLALTVFPVLLPLAGTRLAEMLALQAPPDRNFPVLLLQAGLLALFSYSLWVNRKAGSIS